MSRVVRLVTCGFLDLMAVFHSGSVSHGRCEQIGSDERFANQSHVRMQVLNDHILLSDEAQLAAAAAAAGGALGEAMIKAQLADLLAMVVTDPKRALRTGSPGQFVLGA